MGFPRYQPVPRVVFDGVERGLAVLDPYSCCLLPEWREYFELSAAGEIQPNLIDYDQAIKDQGQHNACGGYSSSYLVETSHLIRTGGEDFVSLSPTYLYSKCNGGQDNGVVLSDLLEAGKKFGCAPVAYFPESALFVGQGSPEADRQAARFRLEEAYVLRTAAELLAAIARDMPCLMGVQVGSGFVSGQIDAEGISPDLTDVVGGHALKVDEIYVSPRRGVCVGGPNSWGPRFGRNGRYRLPVASYLARRVDAFAVSSLIPDTAVDGQRIAA